MDEDEFGKHADAALSLLRRTLAAAADDYDFATDLEGGVLTIEFTRPRGKFVISPNAPTRQLWVSTQAKSYKLDWDYVENAFVLRGQTLKEILEEALARHLGEEVTL